ncbi:hypothetical protein CTI10_002515 [Delftia acidovorans]|uniref:Uncharacterized protein n=1 Tax=Chryseobacterium sp. B5 TaxID=2050562 RepID=A0A2G7TA05_9FLAO|nr:hypothetical protein CTI10_002515 [Delftia acidovorans]
MPLRWPCGPRAPAAPWRRGAPWLRRIDLLIPDLPLSSPVPPHRDAYLTAEEQSAHDPFTPCCSRARCERLVLDP